MNEEEKKLQIEEPAVQYGRISIEEYLAMDAAGKLKYEYIDGHAEAMAGASWAHNKMVASLIAQLHSELDKKGCHILPSDMRISTPARDGYFYPDLSIVCGPPDIENKNGETLLNPAVIIEVFSPGTAGFDKGRKVQYYQAIPGLLELILLNPTTGEMIVHYKEGGTWQSERMTSSQNEWRIRTLGLRTHI